MKIELSQKELAKAAAAAAEPRPNGRPIAVAGARIVDKYRSGAGRTYEVAGRTLSRHQYLRLVRELKAAQ